MENGSGGFFSDIMFRGGLIGKCPAYNYKLYVG